MSRVEDIDRYLRAHFAAERRQQPGPTEARVHPFVTISRQAGTMKHFKPYTQPSGPFGFPGISCRRSLMNRRNACRASRLLGIFAVGGSDWERILKNPSQHPA